MFYANSILEQVKVTEQDLLQFLKKLKLYTTLVPETVLSKSSTPNIHIKVYL